MKIPLTLIALLLLISTIAWGQAQTTSPSFEPQIHRITLKLATTAPATTSSHLLPPVIDQQPGNAAPLYFNAMLLLTDQRLDEIDKALEQPLQQLALDQSILPMSDSFLTFLDQAARTDHCNWQSPWRSQGLNVLLPYLNPMASLTHAIELRTRVHVARSQFEQAITSLQSGFALVNHLQEEPLLIHSLVAANLASKLLKEVQTLIQQPGSPNLYWALSELPHPFTNRTQIARYEAAFLEASFPKLRESRSRTLSVDEWQQLFEQMHNINSSGGSTNKIGFALLAAQEYPAARQHLIDEGAKSETVEAMPVQQVIVQHYVAQIRRWSDATLNWFSLPYPIALEHSRTTQQQINDEIRQSSNPPKSIIASLDRATLSLAKVDRTIAALQAVEAVRAYASTHNNQLPQSLDAITDTPAPLDPVTTQPFTYSTTANTAVLSIPAIAGDKASSAHRYEITLNP